MNPRIVATLAALAVAVCAGAWTIASRGADNASPHLSSTGHSISPCVKPTRSSHYVGLSVPDFPPDAGGLTALEDEFGINPSAVSMYMSLGTRLDMAAVGTVCAQGALPVIEIDSDDIPLREIAAGAYDATLTSYADDLKALDYPVAIDFDHEFNTMAFDWGAKYQSAASFVAAWRHIVKLFRAVGADDVTWVWNPATNGKGTVPFKPWYPGSPYVTWVGVDGYFTTPQSTFQMVFGPTLTDIKTFTKGPVFIDETGANPASQRVRAIDSLFAGAESTPEVKGLVWFDYSKYPGRDWRIDDDPAALAAFRAEAKNYENDKY